MAGRVTLTYSLQSPSRKDADVEACLPVGRAKASPTLVHHALQGRVQTCPPKEERVSPSLPGVSGGVPLIPNNAPRAGGWESLPAAGGNHANVSGRGSAHTHAATSPLQTTAPSAIMTP